MGESALPLLLGDGVLHLDPFPVKFHFTWGQTEPLEPGSGVWGSQRGPLSHGGSWGCSMHVCNARAWKPPRVSECARFISAEPAVQGRARVESTGPVGGVSSYLWVIVDGQLRGGGGAVGRTVRGCSRKSSMVLPGVHAHPASPAGGAGRMNGGSAVTHRRRSRSLSWPSGRRDSPRRRSRSS